MNDPKFRKFRRQLFHSSLSKILDSLKSGMTSPEIVRCADGHFRRVIYSLAAYIADYPEQALLACIVQGWCPRFAHFYAGETTHLISSIGVLQRTPTLTAKVGDAPANIPNCLCASSN